MPELWYARSQEKNLLLQRDLRKKNQRNLGDLKMTEQQAPNPCEYPEYPQSRPVNKENRPEKTQGGDVSKVSNVSKYSRNSRNSQENSHPENRLYNTSKQEIIGHSQYSHCFRELLTSKVIA